MTQDTPTPPYMGPNQRANPTPHSYKQDAAGHDLSRDDVSRTIEDARGVDPDAVLLALLDIANPEAPLVSVDVIAERHGVPVGIARMITDQIFDRLKALKALKALQAPGPIVA